MLPSLSRSRLLMWLFGSFIAFSSTCGFVLVLTSDASLFTSNPAGASFSIVTLFCCGGFWQPTDNKATAAHAIRNLFMVFFYKYKGIIFSKTTIFFECFRVVFYII